MTLGRLIRETRLRAGIAQKDLAARVLKEDGTPISPPYLNDIERDRRMPSPLLLKHFAVVLGLPFQYLLFLAGEYPEDLRGQVASPEAVDRAFEAFRQALHEDEPPRPEGTGTPS